METAAVSWFGMDTDKVASAMITSSTKGLSLQVVIPISADDYLGIADRMRTLREPVEPTGWTNGGGEPFVALPTLQEVMRNPVAFYDREDCWSLLQEAMNKSRSCAAKVADERARREAVPWPGTKQTEPTRDDPFVANLEQVRRECGLPPSHYTPEQTAAWQSTVDRLHNATLKTETMIVQAGGVVPEK